MSNPIWFRPGDTAVYTTRPVGLSTFLFVNPVAYPAQTQVSWHIELCCKPEHLVTTVYDEITVNISEAAGALVTVRNRGSVACQIWTDYI
jgi:hypothetical protein